MANEHLSMSNVARQIYFAYTSYKKYPDAPQEGGIEFYDYLIRESRIIWDYENWRAKEPDQFQDLLAELKSAFGENLIDDGEVNDLPEMDLFDDEITIALPRNW